MAEGAKQKTNAVQTYTVNYPHGLNLRPEHSKKKAPLEVLPFGAEVTATGGNVKPGGTEWTPVRAVSGAEGWVMTKFLTAKAE